MNTKLILLLACFFLYSIAKATNDSTIVTSQLKNVVVYKSGAELTHTTNAFLKQGNNELIIDNISNQPELNSIQIKTDAAVTIMGIEFTNNFLVSSETSPRMKFLQDSLEHIQKNIADIDLMLTNTSEQLDVLRANKEIKGEQTGLSVAELMKMMDYYKTKSMELQTSLAKLSDKKKKANDNALKIQKQINEEKKKNTSTAGRLVLQLSAAIAGNYSFTISYITPNAYWTPFYDVRVDNIKNPMKIIYKAKITQTTGIDWKQVKLSLSTSLPSQWGNAPEFKPWFLSYINPIAVMNKRLDEVVVVGYGVSKNKDEELEDGQAGSSATMKIRGNASLKNQQPPLYIVNGSEMSYEDFSRISPSSIKSVNVLKEESATSVYGSRGANGVVVVTLKDGLDDYISVSDNTLDLSFDIDIPYDVPTNGKEQTATLQTLTVPAIYNHYVAPKLDKDAYLLAQVPEWSKLNLLPGDANIIVENTYIGKSFINPNSTSDSLNLTLGRDKRIVVKREKITDFSSVKFLGSNKLQKFTYEITVKNTKKDSVNLCLEDQFPISTNKEIEVQLVESANAQVNNETGLLSWKINLAPGETKKIRFSYSVKYPKDRQIF